MKSSSRNLTIIIVLIIAVIAAGVIFMPRGNKGTSTNNVTKKAVKPSSTAITPTQIVASPTQFPAVYEEKIRNDFISICDSMVGYQNGSVCICAADYLAANYSKATLLKFYLDYHSTSQIPSEVKAAVKSCSK